MRMQPFCVNFKAQALPTPRTTLIAMYLFIDSIFLVSLVTHILYSESAELSRSIASAPKTCPCNFIVATTHDAPSFDLLAVVANDTTHATSIRNPSLVRLLPQHSLLNQSIHSAIHRDRFERYHNVDIPYPVRISLILRPANRSSNTFPQHIYFRMISTDSNATCPVILSQQPPAVPPSISSKSNRHLYARLESGGSRIVGGADTGNDLSHYMVLFAKRQGHGLELICSGALISSSMVITAAHCEFSEETIAFVGARSLSERGIAYSVHSFIRHPLYDPSRGVAVISAFDIAYVRLNDTAPSFAKFMKVNVNATIPLVSSVVRSAGYGIFRYDKLRSNAAGQLDQVDSPVVSGANCVKPYSSLGHLVDTSRHVCAGYLNSGGCAPCHGDSGGPLFQYDAQNKPVVVAITAASYGCGDSKYPTVYARTSSFINFLPTKGVARTNSTVPIFLKRQKPL